MPERRRWTWIGRQLTRLYPLLFAVIPVLHTVAYQPGKASLADLVLISTALLAAFGLLYLVLAWALGPTWVASLCVFAGVVWFYGYPHVVRVAGGAVSPLVIALVGGLVTAATIFRFRRSPTALDAVSRLLVGTGVLMVAWTSLRIGVNAIREHRAIASSTLLRDLAEPFQLEPHAVNPAGKPSIYLIILDEYANSQVLREQFGFDNHQFEDSLRRLGFTIPRLVRSNYVHTTLSLASLLNFTHLTRLPQELGPTNDDPTLPNYLLENNRTVRFLLSEGYRFAFFPSQWWPATAHNRHAHWEFENPGGFSLWRELARTELRRGLWNRSLLRTLGPTVDSVDAEYLKKSFEGLRRLNPAGKPTFAFAHMILPHTPYVFDGRCRSISAPDVRERRRYHEQLRCANAMVLDLVTELLRRRPQPPLILLQGDHGTAMLEYYSAPTARRVSAAQARERFGAFGAYYLPGGGDHVLGDTLTLVNVFPKVLNHYFGVNLPEVPDDLFVSLLDTPLDFVRVDPDRLR
jgi:Sulfatase